jgi:hypothetical protein
MKWTVAVILLGVIVVWIVFGFFLPHRLYPTLSEAGAFGDSFGCVNSLFASLAFAFVAVALLLQMKEVSENARTQAEQGRVQLEQIRIAERTTRIQEGMRLDARRRLAMETFLKINRDTLTFRHAFLAGHPENNRPTHSQLVDQETGRRLKKEYFDAYTALRSNCLAVGLIFDKNGDALGLAIQNFYAVVDGWLHTTAPTAAECQQKIDHQIHFIEQAMQPLWQSLVPETAEGRMPPSLFPNA